MVEVAEGLGGLPVKQGVLSFDSDKVVIKHLLRGT